MRYTGTETDDRPWPESVDDTARYNLAAFTMKLALWGIAEASPCPELDGLRAEASKIRAMMAASPFAMQENSNLSVPAALGSPEKIREIETIDRCFKEAEAAHERGNALRAAAGQTC